MDDRKLIELVRDHPELYGAKFNDEIWNRIAAEMGVDVSADHCRKRWRTITHNYRAAKKIRQNTSGILYKYEDMLSFLNVSPDDVDNESDAEVNNGESSNQGHSTPKHQAEQLVQNDSSTTPRTAAIDEEIDSLLSEIVPLLKELSVKEWNFAKNKIAHTVHKLHLKK